MLPVNVCCATAICCGCEICYYSITITYIIIVRKKSEYLLTVDEGKIREKGGDRSDSSLPKLTGYICHVISYLKYKNTTCPVRSCAMFKQSLNKFYSFHRGRTYKQKNISKPESANNVPDATVAASGSAFLDQVRTTAANDCDPKYATLI